MRNTYALVDLKRLKNNYRNIRTKVKGSKIMAVIKADAYGHGAVQVAKCLNGLAVDAPEYFAVAITEEAIELRKNKIKTPILVFNPFNRLNASDVIKYNLEATIFTKEQFNVLNYCHFKSASKKKIKVHIKIDTGMGRLGLSPQDALDFIKFVKEHKNFQVKGIYTHFSTSDELNKKYAISQLAQFKEVIRQLKYQNINYGLAHCANSGAILDMPESYLDMVRPGIILYGYTPSLETTNSIKLKPVMDLISSISTVRQMSKNQFVSYGKRFQVKRDSLIASIPIGYADGINRRLTNKLEVIIRDKKYPQVGTVTMDRIMINLNNDFIGDLENVILLGHTKNCSIDAWDWCRLLDTIPYEVVCNISKRVPRIYKN